MTALSCRPTGQSPGSARAPTEHELRSIFAPDGPLARAHPGFSPRPQQIEMAISVARALGEKRPLVVEAGTGVGKSLGYLIPCALWAAQNGKRVTIATYTKALQEQLTAKDLPLVRTLLRGMGLRFEFALMMGSENYLCLQRLDQCVTQGSDLFDTEESAHTLERLRHWSAKTPTGLRSRIPFPVPGPVWQSVCRDPDLCLGKRGHFWPSCLYRKDLQRAREADLLVVNQHLLFAGISLPEPDALVIDEAHNLEEVALHFLGVEFSNRKLKRLLDDLVNPAKSRGLLYRLWEHPAPWSKAVGASVANARTAARAFFERLRAKLGTDLSASSASGGLRGAGAETSAAENASVTRRVREPNFVDDSLSAPLAGLDRLLRTGLGYSATAEEEAELRAVSDRCGQASSHLGEFLACESEEHAYWAENSLGKRGPLTSLHVTPLDVSEYLRRGLFRPGRPVVLTSATLAAGGSFEMFKSSVGLKAPLEVVLDSPFNYGQQAVLYVDHWVPDPAKKAEAYEKAVLGRCVEVCRIVPGGTFVLFTSWKLLHRAYRYLSDARVGRELFKQGDRPPYALLAAFRQAGNGILLGTDTFWQGVDVPGSALSCVIITRLPFLAPDSPLEEARQERIASRGGDPFTEYALPKAVIKFRQGFGRLIRTITDRGAVVILDPRVRTKRYGAMFLRSIPECRPAESFAALRSFFEEPAKYPRPYKGHGFNA